MFTPESLFDLTRFYQFGGQSKQLSQRRPFVDHHKLIQPRTIYVLYDGAPVYKSINKNEHVSKISYTL